MEEVLHPKMTFDDTLRFTPYAYAKLLYMRDKGSTEVAGYGITATEDPLLITDFILIKQECTGASFDLNPDDGVEYMERMADAGLMPWAYSNILIHTHPGDSPNPSSVDENNFDKAFSHPNWAIMFIIAESGHTYCRLKVNVGPGAIRELKVAIDWSSSFDKSNKQKWDEEYKSKVTRKTFRMTGKEGTKAKPADSFPYDADNPLWWDDEYDKWKQFDEPGTIGQTVNAGEELKDLECHWDGDGDVIFWDDDDCVWYLYNPTTQKWYKEPDNPDGLALEINTPTEPWAKKVVQWAEKYADERNVAIEEDVECEDQLKESMSD